MDLTITVVLPVDDDERRARSLAPGLDPANGWRIGAVDNGLWHSTGPLLAHVERMTGETIVARQPFDHLSPDFDEQQRSLRPFAGRVAGALAGLGN